MTTTKNKSAKNADALVVERTFNAPVARVWKALTDKNEISQWSFTIADFRPEVGFKFQFTAGKDDKSFVHLYEVTEAVVNKKLAYTWRYEGHPGDSLVTIELKPEGAKTKLKLTHSGLETFPQCGDFARSNFEQGWTAIIGEHLLNFVEEKSSTADREIVTSRVVDAPRELVWEAMTNPQHVVNWWGPRGFSVTIEKMDVRVGGVWKQGMHGPDGANYLNEHIFKEIEKPKRIVLSHGGQRVGGSSVRSDMTWTFDAVEENKTKVTIRLVFSSSEERDRVAREFGAVEGAKQTLERLSEHLPKMAANAEFVISREFDAPPELVWKCWTDPKHMARWWGPRAITTPVCEMDVRPGGAYRIVMRGPDGADYPMTGFFREVVPPSRLVLTMDCSGHSAAWHDMVDPNRQGDPNPAGIMLTTVTFEKLGGKTRLTVRMQLKSAAVRENMIKMGMKDGWSQSLDRLTEELAQV